MTNPRSHAPDPTRIRQARLTAGLTQNQAAQTVQASLRGWQQWEAGDRAMPAGLFELFMLKTRQWPLPATASVPAPAPAQRKGASASPTRC